MYLVEGVAHTFRRIVGKACDYASSVNATVGSECLKNPTPVFNIAKVVLTP